ncbi:MAG: hypothetical protein F6K54_18680 [Okeania sp. SIO3B5]|uniref:hypothetical protein n=1 Tax=Okeania sp. SIO3B5 TaxID=2607811 RepID=UPI001400F219|nr:hypothetical protein [Okeania sp. SIO3B5]NEO54923.1 hypothetical protein [Okeania sp. SIO3B5]
MENQTKKNRINVRSAVSATKSYLTSMIDLLGAIQDIRLEEVELSQDKKFWGSPAW